MNGTMEGSSHDSGNGMSINISREAISDASYSLGFSLAVLAVLVIISYISYRCNRSYAIAITELTSATDDGAISIPRGGGGGLDKAALFSCPSFLYSQAKHHMGDPKSTGSGCSICLADYRENHMLRLLPECGHFFHVKCIDPWLKLHPTCPICRTSPIQTPLAQAVPLSTQHNLS